MMIKEKTEIYKSLKTNNLTTKIVVIVSGLLVALAMILIFQMHKSHDKYVYGLSKDKSLLPLELIEKEEERETFEKGHISYFISLFYTINQYNYKEQIEKSLWLIDQTGKELYSEYTQIGHYNKMIQSSSNQYVNDIKIVTDLNGNFKASAIVTISKPNQEISRKYRLIVEGSLEKVTRNYPKNPYGYLIYNYREISKTDITE